MPCGEEFSEPVRDGQRISSLLHQAGQMNSVKKFRVLVVEDEVLLRLDLSAHLEGVGYEVVEAGCAAEAIEVLERDSTIRVVFTDIRMPGEMDGMALARCVRERWPPTIIVICSGNTQDVFDLADIHIIEKPYLSEHIACVLESVAAEL